MTTVAPDELPWLPLLALAFGGDVEPTPATDDLAPAFRPARLRQAVAAVLAAARPDPTLLVIDDVQWADDASTELLAEAFGGVRSRPWMVCLLVSGTTVPAWLAGAETITLGPLDEDATRSLASAAATGRLGTGDVSRVAGRSGGNPLFLANLVDAAASGEGDVLPPNIETLITWRIDALEAGDRVLLREAAVAGMELDLPLLGAVLGERLVNRPDVWRRLAPFVGRAGPGRLRFHHGLYQHVAYEGLSFRRRREVHLALGDELERQRAEPAVLSLHFERAEDHSRAYHWASIAARAAHHAYANSEAADLYRRALASSAKQPDPDGLEAVSLAEALGDVLELGADYAAASDAYADARGGACRARRPPSTLDCSASSASCASGPAPTPTRCGGTAEQSAGSTRRRRAGASSTSPSASRWPNCSSPTPACATARATWARRGRGPSWRWGTPASPPTMPSSATPRTC